MGSETKGYQQLRQLDHCTSREVALILNGIQLCSQFKMHGTHIEEEKKKWDRMKVESIFKKIYSNK